MKNVYLARRIAKNTFALIISSAGQLVGNIVLFFYLSRLLQPEGLGIYSTVIAIFHTVSLGCGIGLNTFLPRELPKDLTQTNRYFMHASLLAAGSALLLTCGLGILIPFMGYLPETQIGLYIISLAFLPESLQVVLFATFISHQKAEFTSGTSVFVVLGRIVTSFVTLKLGFGVVSLILVHAAFSYLSFFINLYFLQRHIFTPRWEFDRQFLIQMLRDLKIFAGLAVLNGLFSQSEVILLSLIQGETQVGFYSAALKLVTIWTMVPSSYMLATFPVLSATYQESRQKAVNLQNRSLKYLLAMAFPLAVGIMVTANASVSLIYDDTYQASVGSLRILAWYLPAAFCNLVLWRVLVVRGEQGKVFKIQLITEIIQAVLALILIPRLGVNGAAWALLGGNLSYTLFHIYYIQRNKTPLPLFRLGWKFILASTVMGGVIALLGNRVHVLWLVPAAALMYVALLVGLRAFSSDDIKLIMQMIGVKKAIGMSAR